VNVKTLARRALDNGNGSLAKFAAMRRASSFVNLLVAERRCDAAICPESTVKPEVRDLRWKRR